MKPLIYLGAVIFVVTSGYTLSRKGIINYGKKTKPVEEINIPFDNVHSGDIVFRLGHGFMSEALRKFSLKDPRYSHTGVISIENGEPVVYHLLGGESSVSVIQKESLKNFCSKAEAASFAVYRAALSETQIKSLDSLNHFYFRTKLRYDSQFDLTTDSAMYCTEYVYKALSKVSEKNILISSSILSERRYIACDDIYLSPAIQKVFSFVYE